MSKVNRTRKERIVVLVTAKEKKAIIKAYDTGLNTSTSIRLHLMQEVARRKGDK